MLVPIVVEVGRDLDASVSAVGQARTVLAVTAVVAALFIGPLIDRLGVRPLLTWGSTLALLGAGASAAAPSLALYLLAHVVTGTGVACLLSAGFAGVGAWFPEGGMARPMGFVVGAQSVSWMIGIPLIGILTDAVSWRLAYAVPGVICLASLARGAASRRSSATRPSSGLRIEREGLRAVFRDRSARRWTLAELVAYSAWTAELTYIGAFYIQTYDVSESTVGFLLAVGSVAFAISTLSTASLTERFAAPPADRVRGARHGRDDRRDHERDAGGRVHALSLLPDGADGGRPLDGVELARARPAARAARQHDGRADRERTARLHVRRARSAARCWPWPSFGELGFVLLAGMATSAALVARVNDPTG